MNDSLVFQQIRRFAPDHAQMAFQKLVVAAVLVFANSLCFAEDDLIRLIPPGTPVLGGMRRSSSAPEKEVLWLVTRNNNNDLQQLVALTDGDPFRRFDRVVVANYPSESDSLGEHLLLAQGRFSRAGLHPRVASLTSTESIYNGIPVLILGPVSDESPGERWIALPSNKVVLLGSPAAVRRALDRFVQGAPADPEIARRFRDIPHDELAWSSLLLDADQVNSHFNMNGSGGNLLSCLRNVRELFLGLRLQSKATFDVRARSFAEGEEGEALSCLARTLSVSLISVPQRARDRSGQTMARVTLSQAEYDRCLRSFRQPIVKQMLTAIVGCNRTASRSCDRPPSADPRVPQRSQFP